VTRTKRVIAACLVVIMAGVGVAPVVAADRYTDMQCFTNPAYRSMHEECEGYSKGTATPGQPRPPGGLRGILKRLPVVGGLF
jgi:hypothetical protein